VDTGEASKIRKDDGRSVTVIAPAMLAETTLYAPVKTFLERLGYDVKAEIRSADVVGVRGDDLVVVELKVRFNLELLLQGIERQRLSDCVYLAFPAPPAKTRTPWNDKQSEVTRLCRLLGLGILLVFVPKKGPPRVEPLLDPAPYRPRKDKPERARLLREFQARRGDFNQGGTNRRPLVTAYRQDALLCADSLREGALPLGQLRSVSGVGRAGGIVRANVYGWFERPQRGTYQLTEGGRAALVHFADAVPLRAV
jgi:hypothetical protein